MLSVKVAPYAGAWIERLLSVIISLNPAVAPYAGAWIERPEPCSPQKRCRRRSLRGSVD